MGRDYAHDPCHIASLYSELPNKTESTMKRLLGVLIVACGLMAPPVQAGMIGTDEAVPAPPPRQRPKTLLQRPAGVHPLKKLGVGATTPPARGDTTGASELAT